MLLILVFQSVSNTGKKIHSATDWQPQILSRSPVHACPPCSTCGNFSASPPSFSFSIQNVEEFSACDAFLISQKLQNVEMTKSSLDPSALLTPPNSPQIVKQPDAMKTHQDKWENDGGVTFPWSSAEDLHNDGNSGL